MIRFSLAILAASGVLAQGGVAQGIEKFEFDVTTLDGKRLTHADVQDKVVLIDFWGTWCPPCRAAVPHLVELWKKYRDRGLLILGLNYERVSGEEAVQGVKAYAARNGIEYPLAIGTKALKAQVPRFRGFPTMLFFRRGMQFDHVKVGFPKGSAEEITKWVDGALQAKPADDIQKKEAAPKAQAKKPEIQKALHRVFEAKDGRKLTIGDGKLYQLIVLVHPKARPTDAQLGSLRQRAHKSGGKLAVQLVTRDDLQNPGKALPLAASDLAKMSLGKAFPAYRLSNPRGRRVWRGAGSGDRVVKEALKRIDAALAK